MEKKKKTLLLHTYRQFMEMGLSGTGNAPLRQLVDEQVMGFGTTIDEKVIGIKGLKKLLDNQKKQSKGLDIKWKLKPVYHTITPDENTAVFADDVYFFFTVGKEKLKMYLRFSIVLSFSGKRWKVIHWHGSKPENVESEKDTYGVENWKDKAEAMEKLVAERTMELLGKNRELEVETSLERVRSRSMAMHKSDELKEVIRVVLEQFIHLNIKVEHAGFYIDYKAQDDMHIWLADPNLEPFFAVIPYFETPTWNSFLEAKRKGITLHTDLLDFKTKNKFYRSLFKLFKVPEQAKQFYLKCKGLAVSTVLLDNVGLYIENFSAIPYTDQENEILMRFGKVFQQTYTRFLDLQRSEAQAKEAQIEAVLERVRSRTMGMQKSEELAETVSILFKQLIGSGIEASKLRTCGIATFHEGEPAGDVFMSDINGDIIADSFKFRYDEAPSYKKVYEAWKKGEDLFVLHLTGQPLVEHFSYVRKYSGVTNFNLARIGIDIREIYFHVLFFSKGYLFVVTYEPIEEHLVTLKRFGALFQQTYTRFLDLQKAEAQAREAQVEASLERVRSRSMAMYKSEELADLSLELVKQVQNLGVATWFCAFNIYGNEELGSLEWGSNGQGTFPAYRTPREGVFLRYYEAGQKGETLLINEIGEAECPAHYEYLCTLPGLGEQLLSMKNAGVAFPASQIDHVAFFKYGYIIFITYKAVHESHDIFVRFARVFEQTYTRFLDLQRSEAQAREAQVETALEKVRSRTLAMQKSEELAETASVLFQQLILLGIEPNRLYITIIHAETDEADFWITNEDGSKLTDAYSANLGDNSTFKKMYEGWKKQLPHLVIDMQGEELQNYFHYLQAKNVPFKGGLEQKRRVQHLAYFSKGFIGLASPEEQPAESVQLLERFAAVFNLTFTRFNDLQIAEAHAAQSALDLIAIKEAKQKAEEALQVLQATQKQLVQSEKMASLGELTAGIAHEIQNPLNFVNNFSEVSKELLDEMREAIENGDMEEAREIMHDVIRNLEKINHHGKRADGIVKGMLQHSRSNSGVKESADINALADEYLRLAYHGLRAKDKSFNARLKTEFDDSIGNMNVIRQDIGRVILNLITNAFYAVDEKRKQQKPGYEPEVIVTTRSFNSSSGNSGVLISVKDNGNGIPQNVIDKIFQPFFTTKPSGQGTGLGLSLSYDIVKAHGGEFTVETKEGEGSEFIFQLYN